MMLYVIAVSLTYLNIIVLLTSAFFA